MYLPNNLNNQAHARLEAELAAGRINTLSHRAEYELIVSTDTAVWLTVTDLLVPPNLDIGNPAFQPMRLL